jgi:hypothetical protein
VSKFCGAELLILLQENIKSCHPERSAFARHERTHGLEGTPASGTRGRGRGPSTARDDRLLWSGYTYATDQTFDSPISILKTKFTNAPLARQLYLRYLTEVLHAL